MTWKNLAFILGKNLLFLDRFQFKNPSLEKLIKNLPKDIFNYRLHGKISAI